MNDTWEFGEVDSEADAEATDPDFPWPPDEGAPILAAFGATWKAAMFDPAAFFTRTPRDRGTGAAIVYFLAIGILVAGATLFWDSMSLLSDPLATDPAAANLGFQPLNPVVTFLLSPAMLLVGLGLATGVIHLLLLILDGATHGFGTTVRVYCYASSAAIFGVVPLLGTLVGAIWSLVLLVIGLREAHETATWKPVVAVVLPFVLFVGILFLFILTALLALGVAMPPG